MTRILVLEDQKEGQAALVKILKDISAEIEVNAVSSYEEAITLLESDLVYDLFMLDINLNPDIPDDSSGITFAKEIRKRRGYEFTPVVMITSIATREMAAYREVQCYQYILKPFFRQDVEGVVQKVLQSQRNAEPAFIMVKKEGINYKINCSEIVYIKAIHRGICLRLIDEEMDVPYVTIRQIKEQLPEEFIQCHRMFVVNKDYIEYLDMVNQMISLKGYKENIDIGVTYKADVRRWVDG